MRKRDAINIAILGMLSAFLLCCAVYSIGVLYKNKDSSVERNGETQETRYIKIPSFSEIYFTADTKDQGFNFFNPSTNNCSMIVTLAKDGEVYYESDSILPGYGLQNIKLYKTLERGDYQFTYTVKCHNIDTDKEYNEINFDTVIHAR